MCSDFGGLVHKDKQEDKKLAGIHLEYLLFSAVAH
jgi:hypothetical protein